MNPDYENWAMVGVLSLSACAVANSRLRQLLVAPAGGGELTLATGSTALCYLLGKAIWIDKRDESLIEGAKTATCIAAGMMLTSGLLHLVPGGMKWNVVSAVKWGVSELLIISICQRLVRQPTEPDKKPKATVWTREERAKIFKSTMQCIEAGKYQPKGLEAFQLQGGEKLSRCSKLVAKAFPAEGTTQNLAIRVVERDCLDLAQENVAQGMKTCVLLFASTREAGGGMSDGNNGQEEHICYRSEMAGFMQYQLFAFDTGFYRGELGEKLIHTPQVQVFRASEAEGFAFLDQPFEIGVLSQAAPVEPELKGDDYEHDGDREKLDRLILTQLGVACEQRYQVLVLGAFGCGAFKNPTKVVAQRYKKLIKTHDLAPLKKVVFAIQGDDNFAPFKDVLGNE